MIGELDTVVLTRDLEEYGLREGDIGAIVHCYTDDGTYEVEFVSAEGATVALATLTRADVRPVGGREILYVRELARPAG